MSSPEEGEGDRNASARIKDLRRLALNGGLYLTLRELLGMLVRLAGVATVTRLLGPALYGDYFGASTFISVVGTAAQMGAELWLIRQHDEPSQEEMEEVWTALVVVSVIVSAIALLLTVPAALVVAGPTLDPFRLLVLSVPINVLWAPAQARIERNFEYKKMAWLELGGDLVLYGVSVPLALAGVGVYSLIIGYLVWQTFLLVGSMWMAHFRPHLRWSGRMTRDLIRHGLGYSSNDWAQRLGALSATVIVGSVSGAAGVGLLGLALRLVDTVAFGMRATWRLGMATLSRLGEDLPRLRRALEQGMLAQAITLGLPMLGLALVSHTVIPLVFGDVWLPSAALYCVLCIGKLSSSPAQLQTTLLYMQGRIADVSRGSILSAILLWILSIPLTLKFGTIGYCEAVVVSSVGWILVDRATRRVITFRYRNTAVCLLAFVPGLLVPVLSFRLRWLLLLPLALLVLDRQLRTALWSFAKVVMSGIASKYTGDSHAREDSMRATEPGPLVLVEPVRAGHSGALRRRGWAALVVLVAVSAAAALYGHRASPAYVADVYAVVNSGASPSGPGSADQADSLAQTYATEITQDSGILKAVASSLSVSVAEVRGSVGVINDYETADLVLSYTGPTPGVAVSGAVALGRSVSNSRGASTGVPSGSISVTSYPTSAALTSSKNHDALPLGIAGGVLLGIAVAVGWERLDPRIDDVDDLVEVVGIPSFTLLDTSSNAVRALALRWEEVSVQKAGPIALVGSVPGADSLLEVLGRQLSDLAPNARVLTFRSSEAALVGVASPGLIALVVPVGAQAKRVVERVGVLARTAEAPDWAVLGRVS